MMCNVLLPTLSVFHYIVSIHASDYDSVTSKPKPQPFVYQVLDFSQIEKPLSGALLLSFYK